jgi:hypothetical protein
MKYFYDTEFHEDGKTIDFISIGIVAEDGREYYAVSNAFDTRRVAQNNWLMDNVMTSIKHEKFVVADYEGKPLVRDIYVTDPNTKSKSTIAWDIHNMIKNDPDPEFWAWYSAYDHVCLAQLWGRMIDLPDGVPMWTDDIKSLHKRAGYPELPKQPTGHHNALDDARWNVVRYNYLMEVLDGKRRS